MSFKRSPASKRMSRGHIPAELTDAQRGVRLQRVIADSGVASRRDAEALIAQGRVTVNGKVVSALPAWVDPFKDRIEVRGVPIPRPVRSGGDQSSAKHNHIYVILNKPRRVISTSRDDIGRASVVDLVDLPDNMARRIFPVGRLDADSTGLILLTNDGELANRLTHPRYEISKEYVVSIRGHLTPEDVEKLKRGIFLAHPVKKNRSTKPGGKGENDDLPGVKVKKAAMSEVRFLGHDRDEQRGDRTQLRITLREGQNREIRRLIARLGYNVRRLQRVAIGPIQLKGLAPGAWRLLSGIEINRLKRAAGLK
ncbi:MAG: rRNA pseudouridine synthase [Phycisphaeraceae bacterium]|nr:rRNA pseudouridine synthase [Phycisphaeraceae bacterium]